MNCQTHTTHFPLATFGKDLNRLFSGMLDQDFGTRDLGIRRRDNGGTWLPAIDVTEVGDTYQIDAELPGFQIDDVDITIEGRQVVVAGHKESSEGRDEQGKGEQPTLHVRERSSGSFTRAVTLPVAVDPTKAVAELQHGVLTLRVPKAETARQHKVKIRSN